MPVLWQSVYLACVMLEVSCQDPMKTCKLWIDLSRKPVLPGWIFAHSLFNIVVMPNNKELLSVARINILWLSTAVSWWPGYKFMPLSHCLMSHVQSCRLSVPCESFAQVFVHNPYGSLHQQNNQLYCIRSCHFVENMTDCTGLLMVLGDLVTWLLFSLRLQARAF